MHKIDELPEPTTVQSSKLNRSSTDIVQSSEEPTFSSSKKKMTDSNSSSSNTNDKASESDDEEDMATLSLALRSCLVDDDNENENENEVKNSPNELVIKKEKSTASITRNDNTNDDYDDDIWCNQEDEDNLKSCVKLDREREAKLREMLGNETLEIIREAFEVKKIVNHVFMCVLCIF